MDSEQRFNEALSHTQRLAGIGTITASVAHELNTPISIIIATCSNMKYEIEDNNLSAEQLLRYIGMIEQSAWRSARITESLRNYSTDGELETAVTDLDLIVQDAILLVQQQFQGEYNIRLETELQPDLKSIICDHNRIMQVVLNLLINARDAIGEGSDGVIRVRTWAIEDDEQFAFGFSVCDNGSGISDESMGQLFTPFYTTKSSGHGTGLGLSISRQIVEQHNGKITAVNNPDAGATFTVKLPAMA
jgi:signal transduction histidine kinase